MSANTSTDPTIRRRRRGTMSGRINDLMTVSHKIRNRLNLRLCDIFDDTGVGIGMIRSGLARYDVSFLAMTGNLYPYPMVRPFVALFDELDEPQTVWEVNRRFAAAAVILYLREEANEVSRIHGGDSTGAWAFLGYMLRDVARTPLTEFQIALQREEDMVVELWARKDDGYIQVWYYGDGIEQLDAGPKKRTEDPYILEARILYQEWLEDQAA